MNPELRSLILFLFICLFLAGPLKAGAGEGHDPAVLADGSAGTQLTGPDMNTEWERIPFLIPVPAEKGKKREALAFRSRTPLEMLSLKGIIESNGVLTALINDRLVRPGDVVHKHKILKIERYKIVVQGTDGKKEIFILDGDDSARVSSKQLTDKK